MNLEGYKRVRVIWHSQVEPGIKDHPLPLANRKIPSAYTKRGDKLESQLNDLDFKFSSHEGSYELEEVELSNTVYPARLIFQSNSEQQQLFSWLVYVEHDRLGDVLLGIYFLKESEIKKPETIAENFMVLSKGKKLRYIEGTMSVSFCSEIPDTLKEEVKIAIDVWNKKLKGVFQFQLNHGQQDTPFSDLHSHCLIYSRNFAKNQISTALNPASTYTVFNEEHKYFLDSDIIFWAAAFEDLGKTQRLQVLVHELGHMIGLGESDRGGVMDYTHVTFKPSEIDIKAVETLYN